jgi:hypothetical protein
LIWINPPKSQNLIDDSHHGWRLPLLRIALRDGDCLGHFRKACKKRPKNVPESTLCIGYPIARRVRQVEGENGS